MPTTKSRTAGRSLRVRKGDTVQVVAHDGAFLAWAAYGPASQIRARAWSFDPGDTIDEEAIKAGLGSVVGGIVTQEAPVDVSNVMVVCPKCDKPSRLGSRQEEYTDERTGRTRTRPVRVCKRCGNEF